MESNVIIIMIIILLIVVITSQFSGNAGHTSCPILSTTSMDTGVGAELEVMLDGAFSGFVCFVFEDAGTVRVGAFTAGNAHISAPASSKTSANYTAPGVGGGSREGTSRRTPDTPGAARPPNILDREKELNRFWPWL